MEKTLYTQEDRTIVEVSQQLCQQLNLKLRPRAVSWVKVPGVRLSSSDSCIFDGGRIFVSSSLMGRLEHSEWAPLIAPAVIFATDSKIRWRYRLANLFWIPYLMGGLSLGLFVGFRILGLQTGSLAATIFSMGFLSLLILILIFLSNAAKLYSSKLWLLADQRAVPIVGKREMLDLLTKIESMKLSDVEEIKRETLTSIWQVRKTAGRPSISQRINSLQGL